MDPMNLTLFKAHNNLDHAIYMNSRRERLAGIDDQMDGVVGQITEGAEDLNRRARQELRGRDRKTNITPYDKAESLHELALITEDIAARNKIRRQLEFQAIEDGVDEIVRYDRSRNRIRNNLKNLDDTIVHMDDELSSMRRRHREERGDDFSTELIRSQAQKNARKILNLDVNEEDLNDPDLARLRMRRAHTATVPQEDFAPLQKRRRDNYDGVSDVQSRVLQRAGEIAGHTSTHRHVNHRARYVNIYHPKPETADENLYVKPTRTELNIDYMAKALANKGRVQRRFDVDDEGDLPVSNINSYAYNQYVRKDAIKPVDQVPSNSLRVRSAVCRARQRNALQGN